MTTRDGYALAATMRRPARGDAKAFVLIGSATAVPRQFYGKFASYLAESGFAVLTFDYEATFMSASAFVHLLAFRAMYGVVLTTLIVLLGGVLPTQAQESS